MAKIFKNGAQVLAERALGSDAQPQSLREGRGKVRAPESIEQPRRMIYSGTMHIPPKSDAPPDVYLPPRSRRVTKRKVSPFNVIVTLMALAVAIVLYISNIIAVDQLVNDIHKRELRLQEILNQQGILRAKVSQMSSLERIRERAEADLGLRNPSTPPGSLRIDPDRIRTIEEAARKR